MAETIIRKCAKCKGEIKINVDDIRDVIFFNKLYYHESCFEEMAIQKATSKRGKPQMWQDALDRLWELEVETKKVLEHFAAKDELNMWLLENYNITMIPTRFWQVVADLEAGKYKGKRCKPIDVETLCGCWKWGQNRLNKISLNNKVNKKGPTNDTERLNYDLAILLSHIEDYRKYQNRMKAAEAERDIREKENIKVDYSKIKAINNNSGLDDISDLLDDLI